MCDKSLTQQLIMHLSSDLSISLCPWVCHPKTRAHVRLLGPCFKTGRTPVVTSSYEFPHPFRGQLVKVPEFASLCMISRTFHFLFKVLFIFPSRYLFAIGLSRIFRFRWNIPPILCCSPEQHDSLVTSRQGCWRCLTGLLPSVAARPKRLTQLESPPAMILGFKTTIPQGDLEIDLFPFQSPLLWESLLVSFPPLNNMFKFSGYPYLSSA